MRIERVVLTDDLDPESEAAETVLFSLDGTNYQIDLNDENAAAFRATVSRYADAGRRVRGQHARAPRVWRPAPKAPARPVVASAPPEPSTHDVRAWARSEGIAVNDRGRLSRELIDRYQSAHAH
jgi:hypothetical protein